MCEKMSVYAGEKRDQVNILRLCCGCGVCGVFAAVLPRQYLQSPASCPRLRPAQLLRGPAEEAGDQHRQQAEDAGPLEVYNHLRLLW